MRISDWSSDVCSSDLCGAGRDDLQRPAQRFDDAPRRPEARPGALILFVGADALRGAAVQRGHQPGRHAATAVADRDDGRSEAHTSELQSLMRISYAVFCLKKKKTNTILATKEYEKT